MPWREALDGGPRGTQSPSQVEPRFVFVCEKRTKKNCGCLNLGREEKGCFLFTLEAAGRSQPRPLDAHFARKKGISLCKFHRQSDVLR